MTDVSFDTTINNFKHNMSHYGTRRYNRYIISIISVSINNNQNYKISKYKEIYFAFNSYR